VKIQFFKIDSLTRIKKLLDIKAAENKNFVNPSLKFVDYVAISFVRLIWQRKLPNALLTKISKNFF